MTIINTNNNNTSLNITGLTNDTQYRIRVAAVNSIGTGPYSEYIYAMPSALGADTDFYNVELLLAMDEVLNGDPYYGNSSLILSSPGLEVNDDQYSLQTALLLHGDGIAISDSSLSNKGASINGTVQTVADSRFGTASIRFNGTSYITYGSSSDFHVGTGDFTVETFIKFKTINGNNPICNTTTDPNGADTGKWYINFNTSNGIYIGQHGTSNSALSAWAPVVDTWYHLAILRQSGTIKIYIDGVEQSVTNSTIFNGTDFNQNGFSVGKVASLSGFDAQIDEFRFTNGVARTISLPTSAYPNPSNPFRDLSPNTKKLSISGKPTIFTTDAKTGTSSIRLDSSSNSRLYIPHNADFDFGNGDFTIEFWFKLNSYTDGRAFLTKGWPATGSSAFLFYANGSNGMSFYAADGPNSWNIAQNVGIGSSLSMNTWYHAAVTRSGNTFKTFLNGTVINTWTSSGTLYGNSSHGLSIGNGETLGHPTDFWIDNLKIYKGLAKYTGNFTPSEDEVNAIASFDDASRFNKPVGNKGPTIISTAVSKFGGASAYFDGNSYLSVPGDKAWQLGTEDFTVEAWINPDSINGTKAVVGNYDGTDGGWRLAIGSPSTGGTVTYGPEVSFTATNYGNEVDVIIPGVLEITRGDQQGIYNSAVESSYNSSSSPANTVWNRCREYQQGWWGLPGCCVEDSNNWTNICNYATRSYGNWKDYGVVRNCYQTTQIVNKELIMKHVPTNRYWALKFTSWQSGGGGAFSYTRKEILGCTTDSSIVQFRNGNSTIIEKSVTPPLASGTWYHLAASRSSNSLKLFLDGNELGAPAADPHYNNVSLLLHMGGSNGSTSFIDSSSTPKTITVNGNAQISTTQSKFDGSSAYFDGNGDYLSLSNPDFSFGTGDFTIEAWVYSSDVSSTTQKGWIQISNNVGGLSTSYANGIVSAFGISGDGNTSLTGSVGVNIGNTWIGATTAVITPNQWHNIAISRNSGFVRLFVDGVTVASGVADGDCTGQYLSVGGYYNNSYLLNGYIDELRITKGVGRYTSNFTPSNIPFFPNSIIFSDNISRVNSNGLTIGSSRSSSNTVTDSYKGYIDDLRITKGLARYVSNFLAPISAFATLGPSASVPGPVSGLSVNERDSVFRVNITPPSFDGRAPITSYGIQYSEDGSNWNNTTVSVDPNYDKVSLLLPMTGINNTYSIYDDSKNNHNVGLVGDTRIVSAQGWFDSSSTVFDGTNDNLVINNHSSFDLRNQDWTIEAWIRPTGDWSKTRTIISKRGIGGSEGTDGDWQLYLHPNNGFLSFYSASTSTQISSASPMLNTWNHIAATRNGTLITLYLNGLSILSFNGDTSYTTDRKLYIGGWPAADDYFNGHMNDVRVTRGVARYTSNFDPRLLTQAPANRIYNLTTVGTPYVFRARAQNSAGFGSYGSAVSTAVSTLGAPTNLTVIPDNDKAYVTWSAPSPNNSAIRDYSIQYSTNGGTSWTNYSHTASIDTSIVVSGLANNTSYDFRVAAINIAGTGSYVTSSSPVLTALRQDNTYNKTRLLLHLDGN